MLLLTHAWHWHISLSGIVASHCTKGYGSPLRTSKTAHQRRLLYQTLRLISQINVSKAWCKLLLSQCTTLGQRLGETGLGGGGGGGVCPPWTTVCTWCKAIGCVLQNGGPLSSTLQCWCWMWMLCLFSRPVKFQECCLSVYDYLRT